MASARGCGTSPSHDTVAAMEKKFLVDKVYFHVIAKDQSVEGGNIPDSQISKQIDVLNAGYAEMGISWKLKETKRIVNKDWFNNITPQNSQQTAMKTSLRQGAAADLNIYTVGFKNGTGVGLLGYSTFPSDYEGAPKEDGVVTITHEVGHWVGLYHPFQGGCAAPGDFVADTPAEESAAYGCPEQRDSCSGGGLDPIRQAERARSQIATYRHL
ncbi:hypothetical protein DXG01_004042 [Tephrocybe rancida]|nr:hypothetical protein DXG01_004042 [Tephrocybe rancida]